MTKIAQLHNGIEIHFPDETSDQEMDEAVKRHMHTTDPVIVSSFLKAVNSHAKTTAEIHAGVAKTHEEEKRKTSENELRGAQEVDLRSRHHDENMQGIMAHIQAAGRIGDHLEELSKMTPHFEEIGAAVDALNKSTSELSTIIIECTHAVVKALLASKDVVYGDGGIIKRIDVMS